MQYQTRAPCAWQGSLRFIAARGLSPKRKSSGPVLDISEGAHPSMAMARQRTFVNSAISRARNFVNASTKLLREHCEITPEQRHWNFLLFSTPTPSSPKIQYIAEVRHTYTLKRAPPIYLHAAIDPTQVPTLQENISGILANTLAQRTRSAKERYNPEPNDPAPL